MRGHATLYTTDVNNGPMYLNMHFPSIREHQQQLYRYLENVCSCMLLNRENEGYNSLGAVSKLGKFVLSTPFCINQYVTIGGGGVCVIVLTLR